MSAMTYGFNLVSIVSWIAAILLSVAATGKAQSIPCIAQGADLADSAAVHLTHDQRQAALAAYGLPSVVGLWQGLQAARLRVAGRETAAAMAGIDRSRLLDSFSILSAEQNPMGGETLVVIFNHYADAVYWVWMYHLGGGIWVVRKFEREACSPQQIRWIVNRYLTFER
jgi:hypothetical protein